MLNFYGFSIVKVNKDAMTLFLGSGETNNQLGYMYQNYQSISWKTEVGYITS